MSNELGPVQAQRIGPAIVRLYMAALLAEVAASGLWMARGTPDWGLPEWLINYQAGFIRRGLTGAIVRLVCNISHLPQLLLVAMIGIVCYAILFFVAGKLLATSSWRWWVYALAICPATFAFPVVARTSFRKDVLFFAMFAALILWLQRNGKDRSRDLLLSAALTITLPVMVLCQEPLFVYFPYVVAALLIFINPARRVAAIVLLPLLLSGLALYAVAKHKGTPGQVTVICTSVGFPEVSTCPAGIRIAGMPPVDTSFIQQYGYWRHYPIELVLGLVPVVGAMLTLQKQAQKRSAVRILIVCGLISAIGSIQIFIYGLDWGRWINLHLISMTLLLLAIDGSKKPAVAEHKARSPVRTFVTTLLLLAYATCWSMPGNRDTPLFGYLSLGHRLTHWHGSFTD
jgi:hypothetical protein